MPNTIAENLERLISAKNAIADAISDKTTVSSEAGLEEFPAVIRSIPVDNPVKFYDYDGTLVASYTAVTFAALTEMPPNPSHDGLTAQGWNWTLADAKAYVASYGALNIGQMYITSDGKTKLHIRLSGNAVSPYLKLYLNADTTVIIDWGDGTAASTWSATTEGFQDGQHVYANPGDYVISINVISGSVNIKSSNSVQSTLLSDGNGTNVYCSSLKKIIIGNGVMSIGDSAFYNCSSLTSVTIPSGVTSIGESAFRNCYVLTSVTIPSGVMSIGESAFEYCASLPFVTIPSGVTSIGESAFSDCRSLTSVTIPSGVTSIGAYDFYYCYALTSVTIPSGVTSIGNGAFMGCASLPFVTIPSGVTSIGNGAFSECRSLTSVTIPSGVKSIGNNTFQYCSSLTSVTIPSGVTSIGNNTFYNCSSLTSVTIPSGVTSIGIYAFYNCSSLPFVTIPSGVKSIVESAFRNCYALMYIKFTRRTPPSVNSSATFEGVPTTAKILVPAGTLSAYTSAANYPDPNTYTYEEY